MKKKRLAGILTMAFVLLSACGTESGENVITLEPQSLENISTGGFTSSTEKESDTSGSVSDSVSGSGNRESAASAMASGTEGESGQDTIASSAADGISGTYRDIYLQKVNEDEDNTKGYSLIYLDADDVPELVVLDGGEDRYSIYTVRDQKLFCLVDSFSTVELTYFERCGVVAGFDRWNGGGDEGGYGSYYYQVSQERTLTNDDQSVLSYSYNAVYNEKGEYTGTGVTDYYYMGQQIDETAYREKMMGMGIAGGEDRLCMENAFSREEMPDLLK